MKTSRSLSATPPPSEGLEPQRSRARLRSTTIMTERPVMRLVLPGFLLALVVASSLPVVEAFSNVVSHHTGKHTRQLNLPVSYVQSARGTDSGRRTVHRLKAHKEEEASAEDPSYSSTTSTTTTTTGSRRLIRPSSSTTQTFLVGLLFSVALVFGTLPIEEAQAGFGPSSGATTSPIPGLTTPKVQEQDLDGKKLKQLIGSSIDEKRLAQFSSQLDDVILTLKERKVTYLQENGGLDSGIVDEADDQELEKAQLLQQQIQNREALLEKLEAQPYWFNYLAAFVGSVASTLVMHPVDTIKTRLQLRSGSNKKKNNLVEQPLEVEILEEEEVTTTTTASRLSSAEEDRQHSSIITPTTTASTAAAATTTTTSNDSTLVLPELEPVVAQQTTQLLEKPTQEEEEEEEENQQQQNHHLINGKAAHEHNNNNHAVDHQEESSSRISTSSIQSNNQLEQQQQQVEEEGLFENLYEGLTGNIMKEGPPSALYLGVYESVKYTLVPKTSPEMLLLVYLVAGAAGEMVGSIVRAPAEALKSLVQSKKASSAQEAAQRIISNPQDRTNIFRAWSSSIWRDVPFGAIQLAIFELIKAYILNNPNIDFDSSTLSSEAIIGAFAGGIGAFLTNPADVVTTRIITQSTDTSDDDDDENKPLGVVEMGKKIYNEGGIEAFFSGWQARVGYWAPSISIFLTCYCSVRQAGVKYDFF